MNNEAYIQVKVDTKEIDQAVKKAEHLSALLKEANSLARELAYSRVGLKLNVEF